MNFNKESLNKEEKDSTNRVVTIESKEFSHLIEVDNKIIELGKLFEEYFILEKSGDKFSEEKNLLLNKLENKINRQTKFLNTMVNELIYIELDKITKNL